MPRPTKRSRDRLLQEIQAHPTGVQAHVLQERFGIPGRTLFHILRELESKHLIVKEGSSPTTLYKIPSQRKRTIGICLKCADNTFWTYHVKKGFDDSLPLCPEAELIYAYPPTIYDIGKQVDIIEKYIAQKVDVIVISPIDPIALIPVCTKVSQAGIPLFIIDTELDRRLCERNQIEAKTITFDNYMGGSMSGDHMMQHLHGDATIGIIEGYGTANYSQRTTGFLGALQKNHHKIHTIQCKGEFDEQVAYRETQKLLSNSGIRGIFCCSDNMAYGAYTAIRESGREDILLAGFDGTHVGKRLVHDGALLSTIDVHAEEFGHSVLRYVHDVRNGKEVPAYTVLPVHLYTSSVHSESPKIAHQYRKYVVVEPLPDANECDYGALATSHICPIIIGHDMCADIPQRCAKLGADQYVIVTDATVHELYGKALHNACIRHNLHTNIVVMPAGEMHKNLTTLNQLTDSILDLRITKKSVIIALGGGVVGNIAGFVAALLMRGIRYIHVPTTIMHQADASTGGKQAINTRHGKNILGTFYEPEFIYNDVSCVDTLPAREYNAGMAEIIKHGLCEDAALLQLVDKKNIAYTTVLRKTIQHKIDIIARDPRELHAGYILIYGHTLGHAIESVSQGNLLHGEAISIGMVLAARLAVHMGYATPNLIEQHIHYFSHYNLPTTIPSGMDRESIMTKLSYDKKERDTTVKFCLLEDIGKVVLHNGEYGVEVPEEVVRKVIAE